VKELAVDLKPRLEKQLKQARDLSEGLLSAFETPQQWTHQVHPLANHALWFAGHMGTVDNFFVSVIAPDKAKEQPGFSEKFGMGSKPSGNPADYPPPSEVLAYMRERRQMLVGVLAGLTEQDLTKPTKPGTPEFLPDNASVFETAVWHEALHAGQMSVARRSLGKPPLFG
jgi:hypothetical protein